MIRILLLSFCFYGLHALENIPSPCPNEPDESTECPFVAPANTSMNASILIGKKVIHQEFGDHVIDDEVYGNLDLTLDLNQWIAQGFLYYTGASAHGLNRGNLLLTRDFKNRDIRLNLGDISTTTKGLQTSIPMLGVNLSKCHAIFTNPTFSSFSRQEFFLNVPSEVEVYVDGILFEKVELSGGSHLIQNYPIIQGLNNVTIRIKSPTGMDETVNLNAFFFPEKLKHHETEYYMTVGFPTYNTKSGSYDYQFHKPTLSSLYRLGVSDNTTVSSYFQANQTQMFFGGECIYQNKWCRNILDVGVSYLPEYTTGAKVRYSLDNKKAKERPLGLTWGFVGEYTNRYFSYLGKDAPLVPAAAAFSGSIGRPIKDWFNAQMLLNYKVFRDKPNGYVVQLMGNKAIQSGWSFDALAKYSGKIDDDQGKLSFQLGISYVPPEEPYSVHGSYSSEEDYLEAYGEYDKVFEYGRQIKAKLGGNHAQGVSNCYANVIYNGTNALIGGRHYLAFIDQNNNRSAAQVTNVYAGTSLIWAGGYFGMASPVEDSAILVASSTGSVDILEENKTLSRSYNFFPAIIPTASYKERTISVVPHGKKTNHHCVTVHPSLRSVTVVKFPKKITAIGETKSSQKLTFKGSLDQKMYTSTSDTEGQFALIEVPQQDYALVSAERLK